MEDFLSTGKLFLVIWGACTIIVPLGAAWLTGAKGLKYGLLLGVIVGLIAANVAILERPHGILVVVIEAFVVIAVGVLYVLASTRRTHEIVGVGRSDERGVICLINQQTPLEGAIETGGRFRVDLLEAEANRLRAEAQLLTQQAELLRLTPGRHF